MSFSGLCVGGPYAGRRVAATTDYFLLVIPQPTPASLSAWEFTSAGPDHFSYAWVGPLHLAGGRQEGFWVPKDRDMTWAIRQLTETYEAVNAE